MPDPGADTVKIHQAGRSFWQRVAVWTLVTLGVLCLLAAGGWFGGRWWVRRCMDYGIVGLDPVTKKIGPFSASHRLKALPDFLVCPVLIDYIRTCNNENYFNSALGVLQDRAFGGQEIPRPCPSDFVPSRVASGTRKWVSRLPRRMLEDLYIANHEGPHDTGWAPVWCGGSELIWAFEPSDIRWHKTYLREEREAAATRLAMRDYEW